MAKFDPRPDLPEHLDLAQADVYQESDTAPPPRLGGRMLVWTGGSGGGEVWRQRPDGRYQLTVYKPADVTPPRWTPVTG